MRLCARKPVLALLLALAGPTASACGSAQTSTTTRTISIPATARSSQTATKPSTPTHRAAPSPALPHVGASRRVPAPGTTLIVTIRSVIDPLKDSGTQSVPGMKPVAILVSVRNTGPGSYDSSATGDFSVDSAAGHAAPLFVKGGVCQTPLRDFMNAIAAGELRTGCVAFSIPSGQHPTTVGFAPDGGSGGPRHLWSAQ
ncbi:MAG TPA: DUF4352 domain-containing protein [Solirubrobacteraceae bacterium]|nr:DUF4352 domain-containing protein [Solirubrobacteraceae bacterium]